jgi:5-methylcytosine-specific restriction endonuclease McrA
MKPIKLQKVIRTYLRMARTSESQIVRYGADWAYVREKVMQRDGYKCVVCGNSNKLLLQVNHITPKAYGGTENMENLVTMCVFCHARFHKVVTPKVNTEMLQVQAEYMARIFPGAAYRSKQAWRERYG